MLKRNLTLQTLGERPLPRGKSKKVIRLMKDELSGKWAKKFVIKRNLKFKYYKKCLKASRIVNIIYCLESK